MKFYSNTWLIWGSVIVLIIFLCFSLFNGALGVLGPRDKPDFAAEPWDAIEVTYWISVDHQDRPVRRTVTITETEVLRQLRSHFRVTEISGLSIGTDRQIVFSNGKKEIWQGSPVFEDTFYLSLCDNSWRSYKFVLQDTHFYDYLRQLCADHEKRFNPRAEIKHIKLRSNLGDEYPKLPNP